jgi:hypothetical protein
MEDTQGRRMSQHHDDDSARRARSSNQHDGFDSGQREADQNVAAASLRSPEVIELVRDAITRTYK